jgi:oxaloacetate decarboxylase (Na+ extruding) subunit gamma
MPVTEMLLDGSSLLVLGMGIVFSFLLLLVGTLNLTARLIRRMEGEPPAAAIVGGAPGEAGEAGEVVAAIGAAIAFYRARREA